MSIIIGIDHGYYAIKTAHCSFPAGLTSYGEHEPYTRQGLLEFGGCFFVCGSGRQPIQRDKTVNDNYYLLTLAAIAKEILQRGLPPECSVRIAAGLPLTSFGRDKPKFKDYLLRSNQPVNYKFEGVEYSITMKQFTFTSQLAPIIWKYLESRQNEGYTSVHCGYYMQELDCLSKELSDAPVVTKELIDAWDLLKPYLSNRSKIVRHNAI